jgi:hypothetical protein
VYGKNLCACDDFGSDVDPAAGNALAGEAYEDPGAERTLPDGSWEP